MPRRYARPPGGPGGGCAGSTVLRNLIGGGYRGVVYPVHATLEAAQGVHCYRKVGELPRVPDLAVICSAAAAVPAPQKGDVAFISQSGALCTAVLDWALDENIGFSHFVSVGNMLDVNFGDLIDYFGENDECASILLYMESLKDARRFLSAARAVEVTLTDTGVDAILVILTPQAMTKPTQAAKSLAELAASSHKPILAAWLGGRRMRAGRAGAG